MLSSPLIPIAAAPLAWALPAFPLVAFALIALGARRWALLSGLLTVLGVLVAFAGSLLVFFEVLGGAAAGGAVPWLPLASGLGSTVVPVGFQVDPLTATMLVVITSVSLLVQVYSLGYMTGLDSRGRPVTESNGRYFAIMALFTASMLGLVLANNFVALYVCWELVGLCSYLLIGHEHWRQEAALAAKKAFLVTRLGDVGLLVGLLFLYWHTGTFEFAALTELAGAGRLHQETLTVAMLLVFLGAVGKSAQFPLHVWLPDAMEGPTPVSALIHAATMVAAGVYLMARTFPLLEHAPAALAVVATIGAFTAIFAATMGLASMDIKRVLAFSTMSQLGYMMLAIGVGAMAAGIFHLVTHAFFKALLFLCAGSVIHAVHSNDMREMGGLGARRPLTYMAMVVAGLALAGVPPLSGFWSKDEILVAAEARQPALYVLALITAGLTAFYIFRAIFLTFTGTYRGHAEPHREPIVMPLVLLILIIPTMVSGLWGSPFVDRPIGSFLDPAHPHPVEVRFDVAVAASALATVGFLLAFALYGGGRNPMGVPLPGLVRPFYALLNRRYYIDHLYNWFAGRLIVGIGSVMDWVDTRVVDGAVNGIGRAAVGAGSALRQAQSGELQLYAWVLLAGVIVLALLIVAPGVLEGAGRVR